MPPAETALFCEAILHAKVTPMILGGDHAITAPVCAALAVLQTPVATRLELHEYMNRLDLKVDTLFNVLATRGDVRKFVKPGPWKTGCPFGTWCTVFL